MGFGTPKIPSLSPLATEPRKEIKAESEAARRDLEERMRMASMNRRKSVLRPPELVRPVDTIGPFQLSKTLG